jgi:hypothetical protein
MEILESLPLDVAPNFVSLVHLDDALQVVLKHRFDLILRDLPFLLQKRDVLEEVKIVGKGIE